MPRPLETRLRNMLVTILLAAVAIATWFYSWPTQPPAVRGRSGADSQPLGYYLLGARMLGTDEEGRVAYRILADRLEELPDRDLLQLQGVVVEYQPTEEVPWRISAATASAPKDGSQLDLAGDVELRSEPTDGTKPVSITTPALRFFPNTSSAESDQPVRIRVGDWRLDAIGLRTHLKGDTLELESKVHGQFSP
jgi:LPS export ABC transporter protein LptC